jgi:hypothetical protein
MKYELLSTYDLSEKLKRIRIFVRTFTYSICAAGTENKPEKV